MTYFIVLFIIGLIAGLLVPVRIGGPEQTVDAAAPKPAPATDAGDGSAEQEPVFHEQARPAEPEEWFLDHMGRRFKLVEKSRLVFRKTYVKGRIRGKYRGALVAGQEESTQEAYYELYIYEALVHEAELGIHPFSPAGGARFPRERFPEQLTLALQQGVTVYKVDMLDMDLHGAHIVRKLHQTDGEVVYGTIEAGVTGYLLDSQEEQYTEQVYFDDEVQADLQARARIGSAGATDIPGGTGFHHSADHPEENGAARFRQPEPGNKVHRPARRKTEEGIVRMLFAGFTGLVLLCACLLLAPKIGWLVALFLAPMLFLAIPGSYYRWLSGGITALTVFLLAGALLHLWHNPVGKHPRPIAVQEKKESPPVYEPVTDSAGGSLTRDTLITQTRRWTDYAGHAYAGRFTVKKSDVTQAHLYKNNLPFYPQSPGSYDKIIYMLKNNDSGRLAGLYQLFDSIQSTQRLPAGAFAEMIVSFVQDIPYALVLPQACDARQYSDQFVSHYLSLKDARCDGFQKFGINTPLEFAARLQGDCDTRTLFLYTVLAHYGYDVALLSSEYYNHSLLGINLPYEGIALTYNTQRYVLWETTAPGIQPGILPAKIADLNYWRISLKSK